MAADTFTVIPVVGEMERVVQTGDRTEDSPAWLQQAVNVSIVLHDYVVFIMARVRWVGCVLGCRHSHCRSCGVKKSTSSSDRETVQDCKQTVNNL